MQQVDLIAGRYEWICPACEHLNSEFEILEKVTCVECGEVCSVDISLVEHAYG